MVGGLGLPARGAGVAWRLAAALALVIALVAGSLGAPAPAAAALVSYTRYPTPSPDSCPESITTGPDGALWYADYCANAIGRITTAGAITEFPLPAWGGKPQDITVGPDGALWYTANSTYWSDPVGAQTKVGRITTAGAITEFPLPLGGGETSRRITAGPDGALWFTADSYQLERGMIGRVTTGGAVVMYLLPLHTQPGGIAAGPDGALWFGNATWDTDRWVGSIERMTTGMQLTHRYVTPTLSANPDDIVWSPWDLAPSVVFGPDGALWFTEHKGGKIGRVTTGGAFTEYTVSTVFNGPRNIAIGPDGAMWFTELGGGTIKRITTGGVLTEYPLTCCKANRFTVGPDGALWFTDPDGAIVRRGHLYADLSQLQAQIIYGATLGTVSAQLTVEGKPIAGATVAFTVGGKSAGSAKTNARGVATLSNVAFPRGLGAGTYKNIPVCATFAGDDTYPATNPSCAPLTVAPRPLAVKPADQTVKLKQPNPTSCKLELAKGSAFISGDTWTSVDTSKLQCTYDRNYPNSNPGETVGMKYIITAAGTTSANYALSYQPGTLLVVP